MGIEILLIIIAAALGGLIGSAVYKEKLLRPVATIIKALIPGESLEPKIGQILIDLGKMLQNGNKVTVEIKDDQGNSKSFQIKGKEKEV